MGNLRDVGSLLDKFRQGYIKSSSLKTPPEGSAAEVQKTAQTELEKVTAPAAAQGSNDSPSIVSDIEEALAGLEEISPDETSAVEKAEEKAPDESSKKEEDAAKETPAEKDAEDEDDPEKKASIEKTSEYRTTKIATLMVAEAVKEAEMSVAKRLSTLFK